MFSISQSDSYSWPVTVEYPVSGGKFKSETFDGDFRRLGRDRVKELLDRISEGESTPDDFVKEVLVGWKGIVDGTEDVPFSISALESLLKLDGFAAGVIEAFTKSVAGAKRKN